MIIHDTPKRSATIPKRGEKKVLANGICICPPSARAAVGSHHIGVADAQARVHDLVVPARRHPAGKRWFRALFVAHDHQDLGAQRLLVKIDRLFATTVEESICIYSHKSSPIWVWFDIA